MPENRNPWEERVTEEAVAQILQLIASVPNRRPGRLPADLEGHYDYWFDGGACREITGWTEFVFLDGTVAKRHVTPMLSLSICFPDGRMVRVSQSLKNGITGM